MDKTFNRIVIAVCFILSLLIVLIVKTDSFSANQLNNSVEIEEGLISQNTTRVSHIAHDIVKLYDKGKLIAVINDKEKINHLLTDEYKNKYQKEYPNSSLDLSPDLYYAEEKSYFYYEDVDEEILDYIKKNEFFAAEVYRYEFSNGAVVYVKNMEDFEAAKDQYLLNYVDYESLVLISNNQLPEELKTYGERIIDIQVAETYNVTKGYADISSIKKNVKEVLEFFSYGYGTEIQYYTTEEYDTVEWVADQFQLSAMQLITLNTDILKSETQILATGTKLNVTFFNSPLTVIVKKERIAKEIVYAGNTIYRANPNVREGVNNVVVEEEDGSKNVYYNETYVNGELKDQAITYEEITLEPIQEVVEYGTKIIPGVGTGKFRWPVEHPRVSCHWGCYNSPTLGYHTGVDIQNSKNRYGYVYAADRGTIEEVGWHRINGYYCFINHNNGYRTYYGHMKTPCYFKEGVNVEKGEIIGQIGMTGAATGPHVHFVIYTGKTKHDACKWLGC